jgi:hypothetical protein
MVLSSVEDEKKLRIGLASATVAAKNLVRMLSIKSGFESVKPACSRTIQTSADQFTRGRITVDAREKD